MQPLNFNRSFLAIALIIALLASVPLWAQLPTMFDRFQPIATAIEAYASDNNGVYPPNQNPWDQEGFYYLPDVMTTPIPYLKPEQLIDPFAREAKVQGRFRYFNTSETYSMTPTLYPKYYAAHGDWAVFSCGPAKTYSLPIGNPTIYDATNGTLSLGVILRNQRMHKETGRVVQP